MTVPELIDWLHKQEAAGARIEISAPGAVFPTPLIGPAVRVTVTVRPPSGARTFRPPPPDSAAAQHVP